MTKKTSGNAQPKTERNNIIPQSIYKSYIQPELSDLPESILHTMMNAYLGGQVQDRWFNIFRGALERMFNYYGAIQNSDLCLGSGTEPHDYVYRALMAYDCIEPSKDYVVTAMVLMSVFRALDDDIALYTPAIEEGGAA